jgi:hypothetical protein
MAEVNARQVDVFQIRPTDQVYQVNPRFSNQPFYGSFIVRNGIVFSATQNIRSLVILQTLANAFRICWAHNFGYVRVQ